MELFLRMATEQPVLAEQLYSITEDDLVKQGRYQECGPFLRPKQDYDQARARYRLTKKQEKSLPAGKRSPPKTATLFFYRDVIRLVALLVQNDRLEDARWVREHALKVIDNDRFQGLLEEAMRGKFPQISPHEEF
ncbi:hypothetical protein [Blastopirellula marina]|uniref:hypothetical protein n=1 Tax=Blastopirellula marina TaxID=124 RepID=UPI0011B0354C|nr:hypothetical protein [Blastopirellula marina]